MDEISVNNIVDKYGDMLFFLALHYVKRRVDAEDIVQDVFLAYIKRGGLKLGDEKGWLIKVTVNKCIDFLRRHKNAPMCVDELTELSADETEPQKAGLIDAVQRLNVEDRLIVFMYYFAGYKSYEIGNILHTKDSTVRKKLERIRNQLKIYMEE